MAARIAVHVLSYNSRSVLDACLRGVLGQSRPADRVRLIDCASEDGSAAWILEFCQRHPRCEAHLLPANRGYAGGHNAGLARADEEYILLLNPDVRLEPDFLGEAAAVIERHPGAGAVSGRLLRADEHLDLLPGPILDSTGMIMTRNQRHLDRGAGLIDARQFDREEEVFGVSGAAAFYRRAMLVDLALDGEILDEDFFAWREDADLAWRARLLGWSAWYAPRARAAHIRRVRPDNRRSLPAAINRASVRNRFLLRLKNQTASNLRRTWLPTLARDLLVIGGVLLAEPRSLPGLWDVVRLAPRAFAKRRAIMARRRADGPEVDRWFGAPPTPSPGAP